MNINDWKIIQMRNDVKYIKRKASGGSAANWSLVIDVFLVLLAFALDRTSGAEETTNTYWIVIAASGIIIPLGLLIFEMKRTKSAEEVSKRVPNTKELVAMFDDEVCYMIMSAETFNKSLQSYSSITSRQTALMIEFYMIEAEYYLNKAVQLVLKMDNNLTGVLNEKNISQNHISKVRLINAVSLIASIYEELFAFSRNNDIILKKYTVNIDLSESKKYYKSLMDFAKRRREVIGIDMNHTFNVRA